MEKFALKGIRVADFSLIWAGPYLTMLLAYMGAEVIKVESMAHLDIVRRSPPWADNIFGIDRAGYFNTYNRNKLSISLDLHHAKGVEIAKRLIAISDILVENFTPRVMPSLGLGYEDAKELRPDIIYISLSGYGATGPLRNDICYGGPQMYQSGLASITGYPDGDPAALPVFYGDPVGGLHGAFAVLAALRHRSTTGEGQYIDLSQWETLLAVMPEAIMEYTLNGRLRPRMGAGDDIMAPHGCYRCKGEIKFVAIAVASDEEWRALCQAMGMPELAADDRFSDRFRRWKNQDELDEILEEWTQNHTPYEVMERLQRVGVAATPSLNVQEFVEEPHLIARGFWVEDDHPEAGKRILPGLPFKLSKTPGQICRHAPLLGGDNDYVYGELLGMAPQEIQGLVEEKVFY